MGGQGSTGQGRAGSPEDPGTRNTSEPVDSGQHEAEQAAVARIYGAHGNQRPKPVEGQAPDQAQVAPVAIPHDKLVVSWYLHANQSPSC